MVIVIWIVIKKREGEKKNEHEKGEKKKEKKSGKDNPIFAT